MSSAPTTTTQFVLELSGPVRLVDSNQKFITPAGRKTCALLVLLATSPTMRRTRQWIEELLWSTRSVEQAKSSLRQCLVEIRRSLPPASKALQSDRHEIWLDERLVSVEMRGSTADQPIASTEFAEGLHTKDPAFDNWLNEYRASLATADTAKSVVPKTLDPTVFLEIQDSLEAGEHFLGQCLNNQIAKNLSHSLDLTLRVPLSNEDIYLGKGNSFLLRSDIAKQGESAHISLQLISLNDGSIVWCDQVTASGSIEKFFAGHTAYQLALLASDEIARAVATSTVRSDSENHLQSILYRAINHIFSFEKSQLLMAEKLLIAAAKISDTPILAAWRSFLYLIMVIEGVAQTKQDTADAAKQFSQAALSDYADNAQILALLSQVQLNLFNNNDAASRLAHDSLSINPGSPMAIVSLAATTLRTGGPATSREYAYSALKIVSRSPHRHWWYMTCCFVDISYGDYDSAIKNAENALAYSPNFKAPMRHLYALYLHQKNTEKAAAIAKRLKSIDPGFSLKMVRDNEDYLATLLRSSGLVDQDDSPILMLDESDSTSSSPEFSEPHSLRGDSKRRFVP